MHCSLHIFKYTLLYHSERNDLIQSEMKLFMMKKRNIKLLLAGIIILIGGILVRFAWIILSTFFILLGAGLFLGGIIYFSMVLYDRKDKYE